MLLGFSDPGSSKEEIFSIGKSSATQECLVDGLWSAESTNMPESGLVFNCSSCRCSFEDRISYEIHLQGLKHKKLGKVKTSSPDTPANMKHLSQLETILHDEEKPVLGINYITEYFHAQGSYECACNLCQESFDCLQSVKNHVVGVHHMTNFMYYWDKQMHEAVKHKIHDEEVVFHEATKLEAARDEHNCRSKIMEELGNIWVEFQHEGHNSSNDVLGHQLSRTYDATSCLGANKLDDLCVLIDRFSSLFALSNGFPPSYRIGGSSRLHFLDMLGRMEIRNDKDADVCLQLANFLTLCLLKYRTKQVKNMKYVDASSVRAKLNFLTDETEKVSEKLSSRNSNEAV